MDETGPLSTIGDVLSHEAVARADVLELSICDCIHFRLVQPRSIFRLVELHLRKRDPLKYANYAEVRMEAEKALPGMSLKEKIKASCTKRPEWVDDQMLFYSIELEVWMDLSYPNHLALELYLKAIADGKEVDIPWMDPFSSSFHTLLKEKNGYDQASASQENQSRVKLMIGEQVSVDKSCLHVTTEPCYDRQHALAGEDSLAGQLANGIMEKDIEDHSTKEVDESEFQAHLLGYRVIGPSLVLLIQSTARMEAPVAFRGLGDSYMETLFDSLKGYWPWLPEIKPPEVAGEILSIFPSENSTISLLQGPGEQKGKSLLEPGFDEPGELLLPSMEWVFRAFLEGSAAEAIQAAASAFVRDYAQLTRGLILTLPAAPITRCWCQYLLAPDPAFLKWTSEPGRFPGFKVSKTLWHLHRAVNRGPWPTGSYLLAGGFSRWLALRSEGRIPDIVEAQFRYT
jgi:hypothetical protein